MKNEFEKRFLSSIILVPLSFFFIIKGSFLFNFFLAVCFIVTSYEWHMMSKKKNYLIPGYLFLIFTFYCTYNLRNHFGNESLSYFLLIIIICISTDIGGYFFGKTFKGPKLTKISPNKTYSGMLGGYFVSIVTVNLFFYYTFFENFEIFTFKILIIVLLLSSISQIGDITISYFKRLSKIKNTGNIIPGHGGLLDRIDGMIFVFPFSYLILKIITI
tara:strand:+ start:1251 stop:1898 length:648 start_codon:yes stop_codon:yes gene_type:complete